MRLIAGFSLSLFSSLAVAATHTATIPGAGSWTVPPGVTEIQLEAIGGGGGGGGLGGGHQLDIGFASEGGSGAHITLASIPVNPGQVITYFVGGGGEGGRGGLIPNPPFPGSRYGNGTGGTGGSSTNVFLDSTPIAIAGGGGAGASAVHDHSVPFVPVPGEGGNACGTSLGGAGGDGGGGAQGGKGGAGGKGGSDGDLLPPLPGFNGGNDGYGGAGFGFGLSIGDGPATGAGGFAGSGTQQNTFGTGGGGGGYGGGGGGTTLGTVENVGGGGAGGSMWLGMQSTTPNAPICVPAMNAGTAAPSLDAPGGTGGNGSLKITWTASPVPVPTSSVQAVPGLNGLGMLLLGLGITTGGLMRRRTRTRQRT